MHMLTEKVIRKIWGRCIRAADGCISEYDFYLSAEQREDILKSLTSQKESLITRLPEGSTLSKEQINEIEVDIYNELKCQAYKQVREYALPNMKARLKLFEKMKDELELLKKKVQQGGFRYKSLGRSGWMGADVTVTSDSTIDPKESHDLIVLIKNPIPLTRLMESLRDICAPYLNFANKYGFYGTIAVLANHYIAKKGDPGNEQKEMLALILEDMTKNIVEDTTAFTERIDQLVKEALRYNLASVGIKKGDDWTKMPEKLANY